MRDILLPTKAAGTVATTSRFDQDLNLIDKHEDHPFSEQPTG
jgi:hypothetical protein